MNKNKKELIRFLYVMAGIFSMVIFMERKTNVEDGSWITINQSTYKCERIKE